MTKYKYENLSCCYLKSLIPSVLFVADNSMQHRCESLRLWFVWLSSRSNKLREHSASILTRNVIGYYFFGFVSESSNDIVFLISVLLLTYLWDLTWCDSLIQWKIKVCNFTKVIAWFVVIFGINTTSDISKLLYVISRTVRRVKFETILKYREWYLCQISRTNHAIICLYYYPQKVCNFHM